MGRGEGRGCGSGPGEAPLNRFHTMEARVKTREQGETWLPAISKRLGTTGGAIYFKIMVSRSDKVGRRRRQIKSGDTDPGT